MEEEIAELHPFVPAWTIVTDGAIRKLRNTYIFDDEKAVELFFRCLENFSKKEKHHPETHRQGKNVTVEWWTHALNDLHPNDFIMAAKTDGAFTLAVVGAEGDMFTDEPLPMLGDLPRFREIAARRLWKKGA